MSKENIRNKLLELDEIEATTGKACIQPSTEDFREPAQKNLDALAVLLTGNET